MRSLSCFLILAASLACAQPHEGGRPPVIDIHVHTFGGNPGLPPICPFNPQFLAADPRFPSAGIGWVQQDCTLTVDPSPSPAEYRKALLAEWERYNVTAVVMGDEKAVMEWKEAAPAGRVIPATAFDNAPVAANLRSPEELRGAFSSRGFKVMAEVGVQYLGLSPSDPSLDAYFAMAEKLDIPVGIHMGTGGSGRANITIPKFRGSMGNPLLLEDLLARHPKLRVWVMHAGYPMMEPMLTLLGANSNVYVDVAGLIWSYPIKEVHNYIQRIVEAGFEDRLMYGTDQMNWPKLMATCIGVIETAPYLTTQQKRDILYNNAARFLRLKPAGKQ
jgi:predicted TIM-barrel fold metal-dependent hydrolase